MPPAWFPPRRLSPDSHYGAGCFRGRNRATSHRRHARTLAFETLEGRVVLTTFTVLNTNDAGVGSLREAIEQANADPNPDPDTIDATGISGTITLLSALPDLADSGGLILNGPGAPDLTVARSSDPGTPVFRIFTISLGVEVTLSGLTLTGGRATEGGGVLNAGTLRIINSTLSGNSASGGSIFSAFASGGGISNSGMLTITNSTFSGNSASASSVRGAASASGGGISNSGTLTLTNSTLSGNSASSSNFFNGSASGGGISNSGTLTLTNSTLSGNAAREGSGGGISNGGALMILTSIFNNSQGGNLVGAGIVTLGHNLFSDQPSIAFGPGDLVNTDPLLGPLADNGGSTFTHALLPGSPAIDAGIAVAGVAADQRGIPRPQGTAPDIGAFESRGFTLTIAGGNNQTATVLSPFPAPLVVTVASPFGEPIAGGRVAFTAPSSGASATFTGNPAPIGPDGQASVSATATDLGGTYAVTAQVGGAGSVDFTLSNISLVPPTVTNLQRFGFHARPTTLVLTFSQPMDAPRAEATSNYILVALGPQGRRRVLALKAVQYDPAAQAVTLSPKRLLSLHRRFQLTVNGMVPNGLTNTVGVPLDGAGTGQPGTNYVVTFGRDVAVLLSQRGKVAAKLSAAFHHLPLPQSAPAPRRSRPRSSSRQG